MPPKGCRTEAGARTQTAILDATISLLGREGPDGISASAIANEAGVSKATVFHHFRTIDEVPLVALDRFWASSLSRDAAGSGSVRGYLSELGDQLCNLAGKRRTLMRAHLAFLVKAVFDPKLGRLLVSSSARLHALTVKELSRRLPKRVTRPEIEATTRMVEMVLDGMMIGLAVNRNRKARRATLRAWHRFLDILLCDLEKT